MRKFNKFEIATIKRTAQNVSLMVSKRNKLRKKIQELQEECDILEDTIEQYEAPIISMTNGYKTEDLVNKVIESTNTVGKDGKPIKITKYVLKYPETIIPDEPTVEERVDQEQVNNEEQVNYTSAETMY